MKKKRLILIVWITLIPTLSLLGAAGRPKDGFLFFIVLLGFLGAILGILYLVDYIKILIRRFFEGNGEEMLS